MKLLTTILSFVLIQNFTSTFAQAYKLNHYPEVSGINENGFNLTWEATQASNWVEWRLNHATRIEKETLSSNGQTQTYIFDKGNPGHIYEFRFGTINNGDSLLTKPYYFGTKSLSSGRIKVYFNHEVTTAAATFSPAVFLNQTIDDTLIAYINRAESTLDIAIYNSTTSNNISSISNAINDAYARGVRVRIVYDAETSNVMLNNINSNIGKIPSKTGFNYGIMHNKFVVIDAESADPGKPIVWTGSTNWTVNQLIGPDHNNVIIVQDQTLARTYQDEFEEMFGSTGPQPNVSNARFGPDKTDNTAHTFIIGGKLIRSYFSPSDGVNNQIIGTINSANQDIYFASMIITRNDIAAAIVNKVNQGVSQTYGITNDSLASPPAPVVWATLRAGIPNGQMISNNGFPGTMHHKFLFVDYSRPDSDPQVLTGSHNWSSGADQRNDENTLIVHDHDVVNQYYQAFLHIYNSITGGTLQVTEANNGNRNIRVWPNPANELLHFDLPVNENQFTISLMDISGKLMQQEQRSTAQINSYFDVSHLKGGIYFLQIASADSIYTARFIKY